jgi:hypothetical protein
MSSLASRTRSCCLKSTVLEQINISTDVPGALAVNPSIAGVPAELVHLLSLSSCCCLCRCWRPCSRGCRCCGDFDVIYVSIFLLSPAGAGVQAIAGVHDVGGIYAGADHYHCYWRLECCCLPSPLLLVSILLLVPMLFWRKCCLLAPMMSL